MTERLIAERAARLAVQPLDLGRCSLGVARFIRSMRMDQEGILYRYSAQCNRPTLYSSAYACMIYSLLGGAFKVDEEKREKWIGYFDDMQDSETGLFRDPVVWNARFDDSDWWGGRHLALHMTSAYATLGTRPRHSFHFLESYKDTGKLMAWLDSHDWSADISFAEDIDNKIMNIGCLLQYQRDQWHDAKAATAVSVLLDYLYDRINGQTGLWGGYNMSDPSQISRIVQFAYHLLPIFLYDGKLNFDVDKILSIVLKTQNRHGGFSPKPNSSACEDIDSIYILARLSPFTNRYRDDVLSALTRARAWVFMNQVDDGGFVFRINESLTYGHRQMMSRRNQGAMFPTWFRLLSLLYCDLEVGGNTLTPTYGPGYAC